MCVKKKKQRCVKRVVEVINDNITLGTVLSQLEQLASDRNYSTLRMKKNDIIFKWCTINQFKEAGRVYSKKLSIIIQGRIQK